MTSLWNSHYDDRYFSSQGGFAESQHVFVAGNRLLERCRLQPGLAVRPVQIAELGFGTGLNLLALLSALQCKPGVANRGAAVFHWYSIDESFLPTAVVYDMLKTEVTDSSLLGEYCSFHESLAPRMTQGGQKLWSRRGSISGINFELQVLEADVAAFETILPPVLDAWLPDGHDPAKNPAMWSPETCAMMARHSTSETTLATWCAAGMVKQAYRKAGFQIVRRQGFGTKRHMIQGIFTGYPRGMDDSPPAFSTLV